MKSLHTQIFPCFICVSFSKHRNSYQISDAKKYSLSPQTFFFFYLDSCWTTGCLYHSFCGLYNSESRTDSRVCSTCQVNKFYGEKCRLFVWQLIAEMFHKADKCLVMRLFALIFVWNLIHFSEIWWACIYYIRSVLYCIIFSSICGLPAKEHLHCTLIHVACWFNKWHLSLLNHEVVCFLKYNIQHFSQSKMYY